MGVFLYCPHSFGGIDTGSIAPTLPSTYPHVLLQLASQAFSSNYRAEDHGIVDEITSVLEVGDIPL